MGMPRERSAPPDDKLVTSLLQVVQELVAEVRPAASTSPVRLDSRLDSDLALDSLAGAELLVRVEELFDVALPDELLASVETPRDLLTSLAAASSVPVSVRHRRPATAPLDTSAGSLAVPGDVDTLVEVLRWHAAAQPDRTHVRLLGESGALDELSFAGGHTDTKVSPERETARKQRFRVVLAVEVIGFEPTAPSLRTKCSAELSYTPRAASAKDAAVSRRGW